MSYQAKLIKEGSWYSHQIYWRRFVMHFRRTFSVFPHSYQDL